MENKTKKVLIIFGILLVSYILVYLTSLNQKTSGNPFSKIIKDVASIEISNRVSHEKIKINKNGKEWEIVEPFKIKAKSDVVNNLISKILSCELNGPFTENKNYYSKFEIYLETSPVITLKSDFKTISFLTGKTNSDFNGTFIKFEDSPGVYELSGILPYEILISSYEIMNRKLINLEKKDSIKLIVNYKGKELEFTKSNETWSSKSNIEPETFINQVFNIEFEKIIPNNKLAKKDLIFTVTDNLKNSEEITCQESKDGYNCFRQEIAFFVNKNAINPVIEKIKSSKLQNLK